MSASPISMKAIPGTEVVTCCCNASPAKKGSVDNFFVYIADLPTASNKTIVIKPLSPLNHESILRKEAIKANPYLTSIEVRVDGIFFRVHPELKTESFNDCTVEIELKGEKTTVGKIGGCIPLSKYSALTDVYEAYHRLAIDIAKRTQAQKQQQTTSTGY